MSNAVVMILSMVGGFGIVALAVGLLSRAPRRMRRQWNKAVIDSRVRVERRDANARAAMPALMMDWPRVHSLLYATKWNNTPPSTREVCTAAYIVADEMEIARDA